MNPFELALKFEAKATHGLSHPEVEYFVLKKTNMLKRWLKSIKS
jgi:hypothetical protein